MTDQRRRVSVPAADLVIQPAPDEVAAFAAPAYGELVTPLPATAEDRAVGRRRLEVVVGGWRFEVTTESAARAELRDKALRAAADHHPAADMTLRAQIPGRIARVWVAEGQPVEAGERLLSIEAMKMENEIRAPHAGTVRSLRVAPGARVERNDELLTVGE
jgi:acetyl-CoA/propionyl-CoA carboxylase biotin carboxyl carrier protein